MKRAFFGVVVVAAALAAAAPAFAQGGGASSTGTIQGRVTDAQGAVLPGVTVTATSPSALGAQTTVSSETGNYRFPAVPPGTYTVTYELTGFNTVRREEIQISLGFTANLNIELALATLQETVTVTGESPVIDTSSTRVQQNFKLEQLQSIPNGRDMWALLAVTPSIQMTRIDVGGNRAGTQTGYSSYGMTGQVRVLIEGINTTEGTGGAGFYFDYASLEEAFLGTSGQGAEMPTPGVQSQFIAKSGGNQFSGEGYLDWYNNSLQGGNIPQEFSLPNAFNGTNGSQSIRQGSNEITTYYDTAINVGGPIKRDKVWWHFTYRTQENKVFQPNFQFDQTFDTKLWNPVVKTTYQATQNHKFIGYYQYGQKIQPNRLPFATYTYASPEQTFRQDSGSWVYKGEWNGTLSDKLYVESRYGVFGYYFPLLTNSDANFFIHDPVQLYSEGAHQLQQLDRDRKQLTGAATYFLDTSRGSHTFKFGGEVLKEQSWEGFVQRRGGNIEHVLNNGVSQQVIFGLPTATEVGSLGLNTSGALTSRAALDHYGSFVNDTWAFGKTTLTGGIRFDRYHGWLPEQQELAATVGRASVPGQVFPERHFYTWNQFAPRIGMVYDLSGDGRMVVKANYGLFWHNPGAGVGAAGNPNTANKSQTHTWNDTLGCAGCIVGDRRWQPGEESALPTIAALGGSTQVDVDISAPWTHEASIWLERQLSETMGFRGGFVYKTEDNLIEGYQRDRGLAAYTVPFTFLDRGADGVIGGTDDRTLNLLGFDNSTANAALFPNTTFQTNTDRYARYKTLEASVNRRYSGRWSASFGGSYSFLTDFPTGNFPQNPNLPGVEDRTQWSFKATGNYDAPFGIRISPVVRHQSGINFARTITLPAAPATGVTLSGTLAYVEPADANREDNITVFDVRAEKTVNLVGRLRARLFADFFNITNSHASETISRATGLQYLKPTAILAPFTTRIGFRVLW